MKEAAERLGLEETKGAGAAQWLRRFLLRRERDTGAVIIARNGERRYQVSMNALRRHAPELFDRADDVSRGLTAMVRHQKRRDDDVREELAEIRAELALLTELLRRLVGRLAARAA